MKILTMPPMLHRIAAVVFLIMALMILVLSWRLIEVTEQLKVAGDLIEIMEETQMKWCPHELQGKNLLYSVFQDVPDASILICYYLKPIKLGRLGRIVS